jgi:hypothetical protein
MLSCSPQPEAAVEPDQDHGKTNSTLLAPRLDLKFPGVNNRRENHYTCNFNSRILCSHRLNGGFKYE